MFRYLRAREIDPALVGDQHMLLHPLSVAAIALLLVNDHILKVAVPGPLTGKLSDVAGLIFFPLLLGEVLRVVATRMRRRSVSTGSMILVAVAATALTFTVVKTTVGGAWVYAWTLGTMQWIATLGPIAGSAVRPVAVVMDPTDLLALPALLVPLSLATRVSRPRFRIPSSAWARAAIVVAAVVSSIATSPAMPTASDDFTETLRLTAERPVAVRHVTWTVENRDDRLSSVHLSVGVWTEGTEDGMQVQVPPRGVGVSVIPDEPDAAISPGDSLFGAGASLDLTELCRQGCEHGATIILRSVGEGPDADVDLALEASVIAMGDGEGDTLDADITLRADDDHAFDGAPPSIVIDEMHEFTVSSDDRKARAQFVLRVDPAALTDPLAYPLVGRIVTKVETTGQSSHPNAHFTSVTIGTNEWVMLVGESTPIERDWLAQCEPNLPCEVRLTLESEYDAALNSDDFDPEDPAPGYVELRWSVTALLEAFDGRTLPTDALSLTFE